VEAEEVVSALIARERRVSLAHPGEQPHFGGLNYRVWEPLRLRVSRASEPAAS
jgi:hypothetical protein